MNENMKGIDKKDHAGRKVGLLEARRMQTVDDAFTMKGTEPLVRRIARNYLHPVAPL